MPSLFEKMICLDCGHEMPADLAVNVCDSCGSVWLEAGYDYTALPEDWHIKIRERDTSLWRYEELLPIKDMTKLITMGEGWTPLIRAERIADELGLNSVFIKDERQSPTGSFKDRQGVVSINALRQRGITELVLASTGNKAAAYAAYCARAGVRVWIFLTSMVPSEKLRELALYGAEVVKIAGTYDQAKKVAAYFAERRNLFHDAGLHNLTGREGLKTLAF